MIKKKLLALGVSAVATTAVIGAGFAAWTFGDSVEASKNLGVHITAAHGLGEITVGTDADTLVLDQKNDVTLAKSDDLETAIDNLTATWTINSESYTDLDGKITYAVNVYVKDALSVYVNCGEATAGTSDKTGYTMYTLTATAGTTTTSDSNTVVPLTLANPFTFVDGKKPTTLDEYKAMVTAITGDDPVEADTAYSVAADQAPVIIEFTVTKSNG